MPFETDERLKSYLDTNQLHREQMCRAILSIDNRFSDVRSRHPRGGPDGGRDIEAIFREEQIAYGAVGFVNQANDSVEQKKMINAKFDSDLKNALKNEKKPSVFIFLTNLNLTIGEEESLIKKAKKTERISCEIFDRERLRIALDSPDGFSIRFQYLNIPLSEEEQASFFAKWGDNIQSVISTGFQRIEHTLNRLMFLQESINTLTYLSLSFQLDEEYIAEKIGHFRLFCSMYLKEPKHNIRSILFGSSDKSNRMRNDLSKDFLKQIAGIKYGVSGGQWECYLDPESESNNSDSDIEKYNCISSSSSIGRDSVEFLTISYDKDVLLRYMPGISLKDVDDSMFLPFANKSLAEKISAIHIYSNGYKLQEIFKSDFEIDYTEIDPEFPVEFDKEELIDPWVRIRPKGVSTFHINFLEQTTMRMFVSNQIKNTLKKKQ